MKILMTTMAMDIGGAETHILELSRELCARGHDVTVASNGGAYVEELVACGARHVELPLNTKMIHSVYRAYRGLGKLIEEEKFDVVHAHARIPAFLCAILHKKMGFRFVSTTHGVFKHSLLWRILSRWGEYSLAVSDDIRDYLIKYYKIPENRITVTINGIDTAKFSSDTDTSDVEDIMGRGKKRVLYLGRIDKETAHVAFMLVARAERIAEAVPDAKIVIVGGGTAFEDLKKKAAEVNRRAGYELVTMTGPRTDVPKFMAAADVFVGVSRSAMEAMASGVPVVLAGSQGYLGIFDGNKLEDALDTNFCCREKGDATEEKIEGDVVRLLQMSDGERDKYGQYGNDTINRYYGVKRMADDCLEVYERVVRDPKPFRGPADVLISGYYGFGNMGDDSILETVVTSLAAEDPDIKISVLTNNPRRDKKRFGVRCIKRLNVPAVMREMRRGKLLISGGGSLFQDSTSKRSLVYYAFIVNLARRMGMKTYIFANGVGVIFSERNKRLTAKTVSRADTVTVRDEESRQELASIGVNIENVRCTADPAFMLAPCSEERLRSVFHRFGIPRGVPFFAVSVRRFEGSQKKEYSEEELTRAIASACAEAAGKYSLLPVFIVMQPGLDLEVSKITAGIMKEEYGVDSVVAVPADGAELLGILNGGAKFVVGMRLHMLIYAIDALVPLVGLSLDPKIDSIMKRAEQKYLFRVPDVTGQSLLGAIDKIMENYDETREVVKNASKNFKDLAKSDIDAVISALKEPENG
ncbi:MAG: polysaccharide pyruvyl transferase CsaB [Clostridia bacterium]|nr:polysaccharide pyruvyl transferase CsaB [Clostridia bacterium]